LITDDLSMGAVTRSKGGVGNAAVKALNAGADLLLISFSDRYLDTIMTALIEADKTGGLDAKARAESLERLQRLPSAHPPMEKPVTAQSAAPPAAKEAVAAP
jgi:beta-N-acetylhexosaminidase